jgi:hypothetical protein
MQRRYRIKVARRVEANTVKTIGAEGVGESEGTSLKIVSSSSSSVGEEEEETVVGPSIESSPLAAREGGFVEKK